MLVTQSCPTRCDPTDCSPPGASVHGTLQARVLAMELSTNEVRCLRGTELLPDFLRTQNLLLKELEHHESLNWVTQTGFDYITLRDTVSYTSQKEAQVFQERGV